MGLFEQEQYDEVNEAGNIITRICGLCGERKPIDAFYKNGKGPSGKPRYRRDCKACYNQANEGRTKEYRFRKWVEQYGVPDDYTGED